MRQASTAIAVTVSTLMLVPSLLLGPNPATAKDLTPDIKQCVGMKMTDQHKVIQYIPTGRETDYTSTYQWCQGFVSCSRDYQYASAHPTLCDWYVPRGAKPAPVEDSKHPYCDPTDMRCR